MPNTWRVADSRHAKPACHVSTASPLASTKPVAEGLQDERFLFQQLIRTESGRRNMEKFLKIGGQTREGELRIDELNRKLGEP